MLKTYKYIQSVGVELEGGICYSAIEKLSQKYSERERFSWSRDPSVSVSPPPNYDRNECDGWIYNVELKYWTYTRELEKLLEFIKDTFSLGFRQNETCGNHVHLAISKPHSIMIISDTFIVKFQNAYEQFAISKKSKKYLKRIENSYCRFATYEDDYEENLNGGSRYYAVNFASYYRHGDTLEIRILPHASNSSEYIQNLLWLLSTIESIISEIAIDGDRLELESDIEIPELKTETIEEEI